MKYKKINLINLVLVFLIISSTFVVYSSDFYNSWTGNGDVITIYRSHNPSNEFVQVGSEGTLSSPSITFTVSENSILQITYQLTIRAMEGTNITLTLDVAVDGSPTDSFNLFAYIYMHSVDQNDQYSVSFSDSLTFSTSGSHNFKIYYKSYSYLSIIHPDLTINEIADVPSAGEFGSFQATILFLITLNLVTLVYNSRSKSKKE